MKARSQLLLGLVLLLTVSGCTRLRLLVTEPPHWKVAGEEPVSAPHETLKELELTAYFSYLLALSEDERDQEALAVRERFAASAKEEDRWRLIFLNLLPGQSLPTRQDALALLQGRGTSSALESDSLVALGQLLSMLLAEQRDLERKWSLEKERTNKLAKQLNELKEIEKILSDRDKKRPAIPREKP